MRKILIAFTIAAFAVLVTTGFQIEAAQTEDITITVSMASTLSVNLSSSSIALGAVAAGSTTETSKAIVVSNNGSGQAEVFSLSHSTSGDWTSGTTPGANTFVLNAAFAENVEYASWRQVDSAVSDSVAYGNSRNLWFQFLAPTSSASTAEQSITVTVNAQLP